MFEPVLSEVSYSGGLEVLPDKPGATAVGDYSDPAHPDWWDKAGDGSAGDLDDHKFPIAYLCGDYVAVDGLKAVHGGAQSSATVVVRGTRTDTGEVFRGVGLLAGGRLEFDGTAVSSMPVGGPVGGDDPYLVEWEWSVVDGLYYSAGGSSNRLYRVGADPFHYNEGFENQVAIRNSTYESVYYISCFAASGVESRLVYPGPAGLYEAQVFDAVAGAFAGLGVRRKEKDGFNRPDGAGLYFWSPMLMNDDGLQASMDSMLGDAGLGRCETWTALFRASLGVNGVGGVKHYELYPMAITPIRGVAAGAGLTNPGYYFRDPVGAPGNSVWFGDILFGPWAVGAESEQDPAGPHFSSSRASGLYYSYGGSSAASIASGDVPLVPSAAGGGDAPASYGVGPDPSKMSILFQAGQGDEYLIYDALAGAPLAFIGEDGVASTAPNGANSWASHVMKHHALGNESQVPGEALSVDGLRRPVAIWAHIANVLGSPAQGNGLQGVGRIPNPESPALSIYNHSVAVVSVPGAGFLMFDPSFGQTFTAGSLDVLVSQWEDASMGGVAWNRSSGANPDSQWGPGLQIANPGSIMDQYQAEAFANIALANIPGVRELLYRLIENGVN